MNTIKLIEYCENKYNVDIQTAKDYSEPGYNKEGDMILLSNWNNIPDKIINILEKFNDIEWDDEWMTCQKCGKLIRCVGNSYGWKAYYNIFNDCEVICGDCILDDPENYIETLVNNHNAVNVFNSLDLENYGYKNVNGIFESGLHQGMNDNPEEILMVYQEKLPDYDFIFNNITPSQFHVSYELYGKQR